MDSIISKTVEKKLNIFMFDNSLSIYKFFFYINSFTHNTEPQRFCRFRICGLLSVDFNNNAMKVISNNITNLHTHIYHFKHNTYLAITKTSKKEID